MTKNEMKIIRVVILVMILLDFTQPDHNLSPMKIVQNTVKDCLGTEFAYPIYYAICISKCPEMSKIVYDCIIGCGINEFINVDIDVRVHVFHVMKITGIVILIMIMLGFTQAGFNLPSMKTAPIIVPDKLTCPAQCGIDCILSNLAYPICFAICVAKCPKTFNE
ncbi:hypothetical protein CR513_36412, partial [Mucuna pruriens]